MISGELEFNFILLVITLEKKGNITFFLRKNNLFSRILETFVHNKPPSHEETFSYMFFLTVVLTIKLIDIFVKKTLYIQL